MPKCLLNVKEQLFSLFFLRRISHEKLLFSFFSRPSSLFFFSCLFLLFILVFSYFVLFIIIVVITFYLYYVIMVIVIIIGFPIKIYFIIEPIIITTCRYYCQYYNYAIYSNFLLLALSLSLESLLFIMLVIRDDNDDDYDNEDKIIENRKIIIFIIVIITLNIALIIIILFYHNHYCNYFQYSYYLCCRHHYYFPYHFHISIALFIIIGMIHSRYYCHCSLFINIYMLFDRNI